jgi:hypothetical protein
MSAARDPVNPSFLLQPPRRERVAKLLLRNISNAP